MRKKRYPLSELDEILQGGRCPRSNYLRKFSWRSVRCFGGKGKFCPDPTDFDRRPCNTLALPCDCVITLQLIHLCTI